MAWMIGAERTRLLESEAMPSRRAAEREQLVPEGTVHAVDRETGDVACGFGAEPLTIFDIDWQSASFVEKCDDCRQAVESRS